MRQSGGPQRDGIDPSIGVSAADVGGTRDIDTRMVPWHAPYGGRCIDHLNNGVGDVRIDV